MTGMTFKLINATVQMDITSPLRHSFERLRGKAKNSGGVLGPIRFSHTCVIDGSPVINRADDMMLPVHDGTPSGGTAASLDLIFHVLGGLHWQENEVMVADRNFGAVSDRIRTRECCR
jgi:hypothetical protein